MYLLQIESNLWHENLKRHSFWDGGSTQSFTKRAWPEESAAVSHARATGSRDNGLKLWTKEGRGKRIIGSISVFTMH